MALGWWRRRGHLRARGQGRWRAGLQRFLGNGRERQRKRQEQELEREKEKRERDEKERRDREERQNIARSLSMPQPPPPPPSFFTFATLENVTVPEGVKPDMFYGMLHAQSMGLMQVEKTTKEAEAAKWNFLNGKN